MDEFSTFMALDALHCNLMDAIDDEDPEEFERCSEELREHVKESGTELQREDVEFRIWEGLAKMGAVEPEEQERHAKKALAMVEKQIQLFEKDQYRLQSIVGARHGALGVLMVLKMYEQALVAIDQPAPNDVISRIEKLDQVRRVKALKF